MASLHNHPNKESSISVGFVTELQSIGLNLCHHGDLLTECQMCLSSEPKRHRKPAKLKEKQDIEEAIKLQMAMKQVKVPSQPLDSFYEKNLREILTNKLRWCCDFCGEDNPGLEKCCNVCYKANKDPLPNWECTRCVWDNSGYLTMCSQCETCRPMPRLPSRMINSPSQLNSKTE